MPSGRFETVHPSPEAVELSYERLTVLILKSLAQSGGPMQYKPMPEQFNRSCVFNVPGWRNRQTQRT